MRKLLLTLFLVAATVLAVMPDGASATGPCCYTILPDLNAADSSGDLYFPQLGWAPWL